MPAIADWFVGGVSVVLGLWSLAAALGFDDRVFQLPKLRWAERYLGRSGIRAFLSVLGLGLVAMGILIALGWKL